MIPFHVIMAIFKGIWEAVVPASIRESSKDAVDSFAVDIKVYANARVETAPVRHKAMKVKEYTTAAIDLNEAIEEAAKNNIDISDLD